MAQWTPKHSTPFPHKHQAHASLMYLHYVLPACTVYCLQEYESDYDEYDGEEWYDSKVDYEQYAKLEGYEPEVYCKKMHVKTDDKTY